MVLIEDFINKINKNNEFEVSEKYLKRGGDGIAGNALEEICGLKENNNVSSDFKGFELKTKKDKSKTKVTLFTKGSRKKHWTVPVDYFKKKYGTGYIDFSVNENKYGIKIVINDENIQLVDRDKKILYSIEKDEISEILNKKIKNVILADCSINNKKIKVDKAKIFEDTSVDTFVELMKNGGIYICSAVGSKNHDRGTQFRVRPNRMFELYEKQKEITW